MRDEIIHAWLRCSSWGYAWTACGRRVEDDETTRDGQLVTCRHPGCARVAQDRRDAARDAYVKGW